MKESLKQYIELSVGDLLQRDAKTIVALNLRLIMSSLPMDYTVEVNLRHTHM